MRFREIPRTVKSNQYKIQLCRICGHEVRRRAVYCSSCRIIINSLKKRRQGKTISEIEKEIIKGKFQ